MDNLEQLKCDIESIECHVNGDTELVYHKSILLGKKTCRPKFTTPDEVRDYLKKVFIDLTGYEIKWRIMSMNEHYEEIRLNRIKEKKK